MANSDKNILITPNRGQADLPKIEFTGADNNTVTLSTLDNGTLSFSGSSGQLFSVSDSMTGTIFSVNDVSGIPSIEVDDDGTVRLAEYSGNVLIGTNTDNGNKLQIQGDMSVSGTYFTSGDIKLDNDAWYWTRYSPSHDWVRVNANTNGGLDVYNQTDSGFAQIRVGSVSIAGTQIIDASRRLLSVGHISQTDTIRPNVGWGSSSSSTGQIRIQLPGTSSNYDMVNIHIDVYEYNSKAGSQIVISGHNWTTGWFNTRVSVIGGYDKPIYLARTGSDYFILLGDVDSTWTYGTVNVTKVTTASFYTVQDWDSGWAIGQYTSELTTLQKTNNLNSTSSNTLETYGRVRAVGGQMMLSPDGTYGGYNTLTFNGNLGNGGNRIFARNDGTDGLYLCSATSRNINIRTNGSSNDTFRFTSGGDFQVVNTTVIDSGRNLVNIPKLNGNAVEDIFKKYPYASNNLARPVGTAESWYKIASFSGGTRTVSVKILTNGDNTTAMDHFEIATSAYGMQTHIMRLPSTKYNVSKLLEVRTNYASGATHEIWVRVGAITTSAGNLRVWMTDPGVISDFVAGTAPAVSTADSTLAFDQNSRDAYTLETSRGVKIHDGLVVSKNIYTSGTDNTMFGGGSGRLRVGRDSAQNLDLYVDDANCKITADQDSDSNGTHNFILNRTFNGTGANNFLIQKSGSNQLAIDTNGYATFSGTIRTQSDLTVDGNINGYKTNSSRTGTILRNTVPEVAIEDRPDLDYRHYNLLAGADKRFTVTATKNGTAIDVGGNMFRGDSSHFGTTANISTTIIITVEGFATATYTAYVGINFGQPSFRARDVKIETYRNGAWQTECDLTNQPDNTIVRQVAGNNGNGVQKVRYTLTNANTTTIRVNNLFLLHYNTSRLAGGYELSRFDDTTKYGNLSINGTLNVDSPTFDTHLKLHRTGSTSQGLSPSGADLLHIGGNFAPNTSLGQGLGRNDKIWSHVYSNSYAIGTTTTIDSNRNAFLGEGHVEIRKDATASGPNSGYIQIRSSGKTGWGPGQEQGRLEWYTTDGSGIGARRIASIRAVCETGNGSNTTASSTALVFRTSAYNENETERFRIHSEGGADLKGRSLGNTSGNVAPHLTLDGVRHHLDFKEIRTANETDWRSTTFRMQMRVDSTNHQAIDFVSDDSYNEHIDFHTGNLLHHSRFNSNGTLDLKRGDYQINGTTVIDSARNIVNVPQATFTGTAPLVFTGAGSQTYTQSVIYCNSSGLTFEAPLETNSSAGVHRPITLTWRGGYSAQGGLQIRDHITEVHRQLKVRTDNQNGYVQAAVRLETVSDYRGAGVFMDNSATNEVWYAGTPYTDHNGYYMIGYASGVGTDAQAQLTHYKLRVDNAGNVSAKNSLQINGTTVIDSDSNLTNISTITATGGGHSLKGGTTTFNVGRGDVYFENNSNSAGGGAGLTVRTSSNPTTGSIFDVRSSGQACRLFVGQDLTSSGYNPFYVGSSDSVSNMDSASTYSIELATNGNIIAEGNITAYGSASDIRLKYDVKNIDNALNKVLSLDGINFKYKKDNSESTGVIAQQVKDVLPQAVYETSDIGSDDKYLAVRYGNMVGLLIEAIKELKTEVEDLKSQLEKK